MRSRRRRQEGQALVLIALMLVMLLGFLGLAVDGGRLYLAKRELQAAVDAAALAAGDKYLNSPDWVAAEQQATHLYAHNRRIYPWDSASCNYASVPTGSSRTISCTYRSAPSETVTIYVASDMTYGQTFQVTGRYPMPVAFMAVFGVGPTVNINASATAVTNYNVNVPAVLTLDQACGNSLVLNGNNAALFVEGDLHSDGGIHPGAHNSGEIVVAGNVYEDCNQTPPVTTWCIQNFTAPPCTPPDRQGTATGNAGVVPDPGYAPPDLSGLALEPNPPPHFLLPSGTYQGALNVDNVCYFLEGGTFLIQGGITDNGGFLSNELKPPGEPDVFSGNVGARSATQFWKPAYLHQDCSGDFSLSAVASANPVSQTGRWAIRLASVRTDSFNGFDFARESAPSYCQTVNVGAGQGINVTVSNTVGAEGYYVYAQPPPGDCSGNFGYVPGPYTINNLTTVSMSNLPADGGYYGNTSTLGSISETFDAANGLTNTWVPLALSTGEMAPTAGAPPPDEELAPSRSTQPNLNPAQQGGLSAPLRDGDRANELSCADQLTGLRAACWGSATPGAVEWYMPSGSCISMAGHEDIYIFSGQQNQWLAIFQPGALYEPEFPRNTCGNSLAGNSFTTIVGITYIPAASIAVSGNADFISPVAGGIIAYDATVSGNGSIAIERQKGLKPPTPAARLTQ